MLAHADNVVRITLCTSIISLTLSHTSLAANTTSLTASLGTLQQHYQENDTNGLTTNGILNQETGSLTHLALSARWQGKPIYEQLTPVISLTTSQAKGNTAYQGYLQSGSVLTPYSTTTTNKITQHELKAGITLPLGADKHNQPDWHTTPSLSLQQHKWQRNLSQYSENFSHTALLVGLSLHWQPPQTQKLTLQATAQTGKIFDSQIQVTNIGNGLSLNQSIGKAKLWQLGATANYQLIQTPTYNLSLNAGVNHKVWHYQQSQIENGYQYPNSKSKQTLWQLGLSYGF